MFFIEVCTEKRRIEIETDLLINYLKVSIHSIGQTRLKTQIF